ncbi:MAG: IS1182 family transposase [Christensenellales bacterium]|jgi:transposase
MAKQAVFKEYCQNQVRLLPLDLNDMIPEGHMVRVVDRAIDSMNMSVLYARYPGGGSSAYHPVMMLKTVVYAYASGIYSSRKIAKATRENIHFMWLTGSQQLDFMTINRFRGERLKGIIEEIFAEVVGLLQREGYITFERYFLDGTKLEANASKYSWVWGKNTQRYKKALQEKVTEHFRQIDELQRLEDEEYGDRDLPETGNGKEIDSDAIQETANRINERLKKEPANKALKKAQKAIERDYLPRMQKYEQQEAVLEKRRSYSKTDTDATFMRMKEDHMRNGQLKPGYNVQTGTENQFVTGFSIHRRAGDTSCMKKHLEGLKRQMGKLPNAITTDAGYGSEENYEYLKSEQVASYVKYNTYDKEKSRKWRKDVLRVQNWLYLSECDQYVCGYGRYLSFQYERKQRSENGYTSTVRVYECEDCRGCPYRDRCVKSEDEDASRRIYVNRNLEELKKEARERLNSETGQEMRKKRPVEVESVYGDIKGNYGVRRFLLRGLQKVTTEWGLHCIGHNMRKLVTVQG